MPANYVLLERIELNASAASVTFANIPQTGYTDLKVVMSARKSAGSFPNPVIQFNGDTASNYRWRGLYGDGASAASNNSTSTTSVLFGVMTGSSETANTFGSAEAYIPNYTSSSAKSVSIESLGETNATQAYMYMVAGLWTGTAAITSVAVLPGNADPFVANSTFSLYGLAALGTTPVIAPKASGGNRIDYDGTYWIHTFNTSGTFTPQVELTCDYLVVAGGGGGGGYGGGGGAGGYRTATGFSVTATPYAITVGAGGANAATTASGGAGSNSIFSSITSTGGGGGAGFNAASNSGGSGGGGGISTAGGSPGGGAASPAGQGNNGGNGTSNDSLNIRAGGGGGGAGAVGGNGANCVGGNGGAGTSSSITGTAVTRAGGGGGGADSRGASPAAGAGGSGGGGAGTITTTPATSGTTNLGGGGGGGTFNGSYIATGAGGSGVVIIRYLAI